MTAPVSPSPREGEDELGPQSGFLAAPFAPWALIPVGLYAALSAVVSYLAADRSFFDICAPLSSETIEGVGGWRIPIGMLIHTGPRHFLANFLFLVPFGALLTRHFGLFVFPVLALILGIATHALALATYVTPTALVGSSGLVYVVFGLWLALYYAAEAHVPRRRRWLMIIGFGLIMLTPALIPTPDGRDVSFRAHGIGLALGLVAGSIYALLNRSTFARRNRDEQERRAREAGGEPPVPPI